MVIRNEQILDAAAEVLVQRPNATLQSIANAAGISRTTIFNRYSTREDLLEALGAHALQRIAAVMQRIPSPATGGITAVLLDVTEGLMPLGPHSAFLRRAPVGDNMLDAHWQEAVAPLVALFVAAQSRGQLRSQIPIRWLVGSYVSLLFGGWDELRWGSWARCRRHDWSWTRGWPAPRIEVPIPHRRGPHLLCIERPEHCAAVRTPHGHPSLR